jgi:starvation-inducible DNA-binding protein
MRNRPENAAVIEVLVPRPRDLHHYGTVALVPMALDASVRGVSVGNLNQLLVDTMTLRDMYKKHHGQLSGPTWYQLHRLFDEHFHEQSELVNAIAERIQTLSGVSSARVRAVAEMTLIPRLLRGGEEVPAQLSRVLHAHESLLNEARAMARQASEGGDDGTNNLLLSEVIRTNERQVWVVAEHLVNSFRVGNAARCFGFVKAWVEKKVRPHLMWARGRQGFGWKRWRTARISTALGVFDDSRAHYRARV